MVQVILISILSLVLSIMVDVIFNLSGAISLLVQVIICTTLWVVVIGFKEYKGNK